MRDLKQLLNLKANSSHLTTEIRLHDGAIEDLKANLMEMKTLQLGLNQEHQLQLNRSKQELQKQLDNSFQKIGELRYQANDSAQKN